MSPTPKNPEDPEHHPPFLLLPPLCHPHIHLDKPYILTANHPDFADLVPITGQFHEALALTSAAKERYTPEDLFRRGEQLLAASYSYGVTSLRAFVEVDHVTNLISLEAALRLKDRFAHLMQIQICVFAQDPLFSTCYGDANLRTLDAAIAQFQDSIEAIGTTPYVEASRDAARANVEWAITTALKHAFHLDFHLDYTLEPHHRPMAFEVIELLRKHHWRQVADASKTIVLGHCTHFSASNPTELQSLAAAIHASQLPIYFVGLPTSDLYMMGRPSAHDPSSQNRPRGTINVPSLIQEHRLSACLGVNNVGNAFTPFGTGDPLQLASWAVGIYHAGTTEEANLLYECVSTRARRAIGLDPGQTFDVLDQHQPVSGMLRLRNPRSIEVPGAPGQPPIRIGTRPRLSLKDVVWDPPEVNLRSIVRKTGTREKTEC
ncbi:hypothetical protein F5Y16DRAFT_172735 [Xylariaceae sp. FL0255]|nr:hypothetical protein F5Y16DRAFT_172735 [Xylariaceae sp. FL0255]